jgi:RNA:NAD 2'-phosphotransferase (TPT1/KptA family)
VHVGVDSTAQLNRRQEGTMTREIDQLIDALRDEYPEITVEQLHEASAADDAGHWYINHPAGLAEVQIEAHTGHTPFLVESDLAPPTLARTIDDARRLVTERLGLSIGMS